MANHSSLQMRVGIIGLGGAARQILPSFQAHPGVSIAAGADPSAEVRAAFEREFSVPVFASAEDLCACADVDVVYIATPHQFHREHAVIAAQAGKHLIVEKPMALTMEDCDAMIAAAESAGVLLIVGHTHAFDAPIIKMRELIAAGKIGPVSLINAFNYTNFLYRPRRPEELDIERGGGAIYNQATHQVDIVRFLEGGKVKSVRSAAWALDPDRPVDGAYSAFLQFESGAVATIMFSGYDFFDSDEFHDWTGELGETKTPRQNGSARRALGALPSGTDEAALKARRGVGWDSNKDKSDPQGAAHPHFGVIIVSGPNGDLRQTARGIELYGPDGPREFPLDAPKVFPDKIGIVEEMYQAFSGARPLVRDGRWARATMEVCLAIRESAQEGREIQLSRQVGIETGPEEVKSNAS